MRAFIQWAVVAALEEGGAITEVVQKEVVGRAIVLEFFSSENVSLMDRLLGAWLVLVSVPPGKNFDLLEVLVVLTAPPSPDPDTSASWILCRGVDSQVRETSSPS